MPADTTDLGGAVAALANGHELAALRKAVHASGEAIFLTDRDGTFTYVNPAFCALYGWQPDELIGKATPRVIKSGVLPPEAYEHFWRAITSGEIVAGEIVNRHRDGALRIVASSANPIADDDGEVVGFFAIQTDVAERHRADQERARLAAVVEQSTDAVVIFDTNLAIVYVNEAFERSTGFSREEAVGLSMWAFRTADQDASFYDDVIATLESGADWSGRMTNRSRAGETLPRQVTIRVLRDDHGKPHSYISTARDVSREEALQAQLTQAQKMEAVGQLAGGVAHDFNNILSIVLSCADLVLDDLTEQSTIRDDLLIIRDAARRGASVTRQLLTFSRHHVSAPVALDVDDLIGVLLDLLQKSVGEAITVATALGAAPLLVKADPGNLEQVLLNLVLNARDAMAGEGEVRIKTAKVDLGVDDIRPHQGLSPGPHVRIVVADNGCGMTREVADRAFEPFFTTKPQGKGTGLGLAIAYGVVKGAGGDISLRSDPGVGTRFEILLPTTDDDLEAAPPSKRERTAGDGARTVLLVEDEDGVRALATRILERAGYTVHAARDGVEGLEVYAREAAAIDLVVTDVVMPRLSGPAMADSLWVGRPDLPVLFMSGYADMGGDPRLQGATQHVLAKPFVGATLTGAVAKLIDDQQRPDEP